MNILDPILSGYIFSELYHQVGKEQNGKGMNTPVKENTMLKFSAAYPISGAIKDLPEGLRDKMIPIGLVKIDATMVIPTEHKIKEDDKHEMMPADIFDKLVEQISAPFPKKFMKAITLKSKPNEKSTSKSKNTSKKNSKSK
jgi:hypothetical protein